MNHGDDDEVGSMNDNILKESEGFNTNKHINAVPKEIKSIQELMKVLCIKYRASDHSFNLLGKDYVINIDSLADNLGYQKKKEKKIQIDRGDLSSSSSS